MALRFLFAGSFLLSVMGCASPQERTRILKDNESLRGEKERLDRALQERDAAMADLRKEVQDLQGFGGAQRSLTDLAPVAMEIASLSGGADYDGKPGDDGVTVYVRPRDADGDTVKVPGRMQVQLLDNSNLSSPVVIGMYRFEDLAANRKLWHGKFGTQHYTLKCPFPDTARLPESRKLLLSVEFVDLITAATLRATAEVSFSRPAP